jgi:chorismate mutase
MVSDWQVRGIRGATTVERNDPEYIRDAVLELFQVLIKENNLAPENVVSATFTLTSDLNAAYPSTFVREYLEGWDQVPLLDLAQLSIPGSLPRCLRVLLHVNSPLKQDQIQHAYLREAKQLRLDLQHFSSV